MITPADVIIGSAALSLSIILVAAVINRLRWWRARQQPVRPQQTVRPQQRTLDSEWVGIDDAATTPRSGIFFPEL